MRPSRELNVEFDTTVHPLEAIQAAAYLFTDRFDVRLERKGRGAARVRLTPKRSGTTGLERVEGDLRNEVLHETLRLKVSRANRKIREFIVTKSLVSAQVPSALPPSAADAVAAARAACPECDEAGSPSAAPPIDAELEKEIEKLLAEVEKGGEDQDPLGVSVTWEEKYGSEAAVEKDGKPKKGAVPKPDAKEAGR